MERGWSDQKPTTHGIERKDTEKIYAYDNDGEHKLIKPTVGDGKDFRHSNVPHFSFDVVFLFNCFPWVNGLMLHDVIGILRPGLPASAKDHVMLTLGESTLP